MRGKCVVCGKMARMLVITDFYKSDLKLSIHDKCWEKLDMEKLDKVVGLREKDGSFKSKSKI